MSSSDFSKAIKSKSKVILLEREAQIAVLQQQIATLTHQLAVSSATTGQGSSSSSSNRTPTPKRPAAVLTPHSITLQEEFDIRGPRGTSSERRIQRLTHQRTRIGRNASFSTRHVLESLPRDHPDDEDDDDVDETNFHKNRNRRNTHILAQRILDMFQSPASHVDYLQSTQFAHDVLKLTHKVKTLLEYEPRVAFLPSPAYIFGDIHGNLEDLHFFSDNVWRLGMSLTAGKFVFLGDYVDRGLMGLECVAYLLALKLMLPHKVCLLRGNHETRDVNGWEEHYGDRSFLCQCRRRFGDELGYQVWEQTNQVFDRMPLAAVLDQDIFCVHGGIPRPVSNTTNRIQDILSVPKVAGINPPYEHEDDVYQQVASDCIWSDPASEEQELTSVNSETGFGESLRGGGAICFGNKAVTTFLQQQGYSYIMRAHEAHAEGVAVSKGARVFTVFSTSKDHNQGSHAMAGCILVDFEKLHVINRSPAYKNQYVHRRDSVSLAALPESEIQKRMKLGLVTDNLPSDDEEEWHDFADGDDGTGGEDEENEIEEEYVFDKNRRSSIDLSSVNDPGDSMSSLDTDFNRSDGSCGSSLVLVDFDASKRHRSRRPRVSSIHEEVDGSIDPEEIETVDGDESLTDWGNTDINVT